MSLIQLSELTKTYLILQRLKLSLGISGHALLWFASYLSKKQNPAHYEYFRSISLISHIEILLLKVLLKITKNKIIHKSSEEQSGFEEECGCRNAMYILRMLSECFETQKDLYMCFIDYEKSFDIH